MSWIRLRALSCATLLLLGSCSSPKLSLGVGAFRVTFAGTPDIGSLDKPLPFAVTKEQSFTLDIEALRNDRPGEADPTFNGFALIQVRPTGKITEEPLAVRIVNGVARGVKVGVLQAFGPVRLVAVDLGYVPAVKIGAAACNNGLDDDGNGFVDSPHDRGCYAGADDTEGGQKTGPVCVLDVGCGAGKPPCAAGYDCTGGRCLPTITAPACDRLAPCDPGAHCELITSNTGASGASPLIYFANPRISDIDRPGKNKDESALKGTRVKVDSGFMLVTRVSTDGLYITDYEGAKWDGAKKAWTVDTGTMAYQSIFAFNFSTPLNITEGDCLVQLDGTVGEFYQYTELNQPTWKKGDFAFCAVQAVKAGQTACNVTSEQDGAKGGPCRLSLEELANTPFDLTKMMVDVGGNQRSVWDQKYLADTTERFESALVQIDDIDMFTELRKCDKNGNGVVDFSDKDEADCSNSCGDAPTCQVAETFFRYNQWTVSFTDGAGALIKVAVQAAGAIPKFKPRDPRVISDDQDKTLLKPQRLGKLVGTMRHLGFARPAWIIEPRRVADCPDCKN